MSASHVSVSHTRPVCCPTDFTALCVDWSTALKRPASLTAPGADIEYRRRTEDLTGRPAGRRQPQIHVYEIAGRNRVTTISRPRPSSTRLISVVPTREGSSHVHTQKRGARVLIGRRSRSSHLLANQRLRGLATARSCLFSRDPPPPPTHGICLEP